MSKAQEISNCPFCGESRAYVSDIDSAAIHMGCRGCGAQLWGKTHHFGSHAEAIDAWNRRAASSEQQAAQQDAERWREHVGNLDALIAFCPTCSQGYAANAEMTRDEIIFECGKTSGRTVAQKAAPAMVRAADLVAVGNRFYGGNWLSVEGVKELFDAAFSGMRQELAMDFSEAYEGSREDLSIWKRRALEAERDLRTERETASRLVSEVNAAYGPTHLCEPANVSPSDVLELAAEAVFEADKRMWLSGPTYADLHEKDKQRCRAMAIAARASNGGAA